MQHLETLNERQKEAVEHTEGPLLIIAGAGAGKTRVITRRILHLIQKGVAPETILAITFTNKAAKEMRDRVHNLLSKNPLPSISLLHVSRFMLHAPWIGTFHSLGVHILREQHKYLGIRKHFMIFDRADSLGAIKTAIKRAGADKKTFEPGSMLSAISREKGNIVTAESFGAHAGNEYVPRLIAAVWEEYEKILAEEKALDFDDLLLKTVLLLQTQKEIREQYQKKWRYIHIDEYQDTNRVQYELIRLLAEEHKNIAVVGDADQNIYQWRGATIKNILDFEKHYREAATVVLEENYRSTQTILAVANRIIEKNKMRRDKTLFTKQGAGEKIGLYSAYDEADEARFIALKSKELIELGNAPREVAVLFRANFQSRAIEEAFLEREIPYQVVGVRFFERREVKDIISYVRLAFDRESIGDMKRIINVPPRGIGKVSLLKILAGREDALPDATQEKVARFRRALAEMKKALETKKLSEALRFILSASGIEKTLKDGSEDDIERLENIRELVTFALKYDHLPPQEAAAQFLEEAALQSDQDEIKEEKNAVRLMTVHSAKGLEFEYVFITGLEQDLFPHARADSDTGGKAAEKAEEERRLFYVALTRAKKKIFLSYASIRTIFGSRQVNVPSEFIFDVPEEHLEIEETNIRMYANETNSTNEEKSYLCD